MLLFVAGIFTNCSTEDTTVAGPTISFANNVSTFEIDFATMANPYTHSFVVMVQADGKIKTFTAKKKDASGASSNKDIIGEFAGKTTFIETITEIFASTDSFPIQLIFNVTDNNSKGMEKIFTITKKSVAGFAQTKNGMFYHIAGLLQGAWDLDGDALVAAAGSASAKSMKNTDLAGIAFTGSWTSDNSTTFVKSNTYTYASANPTTAAATFTAGSATGSVTNPEVNDIYIAKKSSTYYVIKILTVDPAFNTGTGGNTGKITFEYKKN